MCLRNYRAILVLDMTSRIKRAGVLGFKVRGSVDLISEFFLLYNDAELQASAPMAEELELKLKYKLPPNSDHVERRCAPALRTHITNAEVLCRSLRFENTQTSSPPACMRCKRSSASTRKATPFPCFYRSSPPYRESAPADIIKLPKPFERRKSGRCAQLNTLYLVRSVFWAHQL